MHCHTYSLSRITRIDCEDVEVSYFIDWVSVGMGESEPCGVYEKFQNKA